MSISEREIRKTLDSVITELEKHNIKHNDDYDVVGIGDVVEQVLSKLGISEENFKAFFGLQECQCTDRKKFLNSLFYWRQKRKNGV